MRLLFVFTALLLAAAAQPSEPRARGYLGVAITDPGDGRAGALVGLVAPGGPAEKAGVRPADLVIAVDGAPVDGVAAFRRILSTMRPNQPVQLTVVRGRGQRMTIAVTVGAPPGPVPPETSPAPPQVAASPPAPGKPLTVSAYRQIADSWEKAFTVDVPAGWRSEAGLVRHAALQIRPYIRALAPDKMVYLMAGEPSIPGYVPPSRMLNDIGMPEGHVYQAGPGGLAMVLRYLSGVEFAKGYGQVALGGLCPGLRLVSSQDRPDLARQAEKLWPTIIPSVYSGGEAVFTCTHGKQPMEARMEAATMITRDRVLWEVMLLQAVIAPPTQSEQARSILAHILASVKWSPAWTQMQNNLSAQAAAEINRRAEQTLRQQRAQIDKLNAADEEFESMDEIVSGYSRYRDPTTGDQ